ncbi:GNAT family N-acetyltransferase [Poseidonibacter lekithochrous]|uniref:GNAT family N-acetyltransferase n=1 Tax=Poseidonibacter lekithochrous TaxID=1904463 RepID=UPI0008FC406A|nr:GNAT family acetyltransferase [Poseidonibacter lekithochrous]QKJ24312.1 acetyltransferase [Poseidonibacter lekithochrous]
MKLKIAEVSDIDGILKLHNKYQIDSIKEEDKKDGFVTTAFSQEELKNIIVQEQGIFIAIQDDEVMGYVMSASWQYWSKWPMFAFMIEELPKLEYLGQTLRIGNSYQYGPVCIDKRVRGTGLLEQLFDFALESMSQKYPILVTFVNKVNVRSYEAHKRKLGLEVIQEFEYNNNQYYEFVYDTSKRVLN